MYQTRNKNVNAKIPPPFSLNIKKLKDFKINMRLNENNMRLKLKRQAYILQFILSDKKWSGDEIQ